MKPKNLALAKLELQIMKVIWDSGQATIREVMKTLTKKGVERTYSTIMTMMRNLEKKGFLTHDLRERTFVYKPLVQRDEVSQNMLFDLLDRLFDGSREQLFSTLFQREEVDVGELESLKELIEQKQKEINDVEP